MDDAEKRRRYKEANLEAELEARRRYGRSPNVKGGTRREPL